MIKFIIRNDDICYDTSLDEIKSFCEICDKHGYRIIQSITPIGLGGRRARAHMKNEDILIGSFRRFEENTQLVDYLKKRSDLIGVHGLWHTHVPTELEIAKAKELLQNLGFEPTYFVPPFNEGDYPKEVTGLTTCKLSMEAGERLEDFLSEGEPQSPIMYLHSWRFNSRPHTFDQLDKCLARLAPRIIKISDLEPDEIRLWYNFWVKDNALGKVLDVGKSKHWDYGFPTLDVDPRMNATYTGSIEDIDFPDESFDTVLCNGMYEFVSNPQAMIDEALRITKKGGTAIFGFVGPDYKPYKKDWKFYEGKEDIPITDRYDFDKKYHFLICKKS